ncbi:Sucrase/ferredoxin-like-domain-containing protein [Microdochium trichocladiopsis]|uniref:Sucrase/ferredoxin-like-domain-containing protein n=1 Tax=Microdochium trichocladiopsis TaxID=1682393 RepID=A0A9P8Y2F3_9PEZI|nr:Sucrase/ferredoxin-like-domain-containing protein [Microdochium trichocladiopsis]KAH7027871.1 Sucrase/ferredoxin-like-domain-containing protein [Microdochium trichocladiopsis]
MTRSSTQAPGGGGGGGEAAMSSSPATVSPSPPTTTTTTTRRRQPPLKQKMALSLQSLVWSAQRLVLGDTTATPADTNTPATPAGLFPPTDPAADGDDCAHDCQSCSIKYPCDFKIDEADQLYGYVKGWSTYVLVATGKSDWVRDVADEKGSVMQALDRHTSSLPSEAKQKMGRMMLSASNIPTPHGTSDYSEPTTVLLLPAFAVIHNVSPATVPAVVDNFVSRAATSTTPLSAPLSIPRSVPLRATDNSTTTTATTAALTATPSPHNVLILLCSQKTRDARCGQSAPLLKRELERHLRPLGLYRDADDHRPGGVGIYFISHVGGHKYSANMMVYRRANAFGVDDVDRGAAAEAGGADAFKIDPLARFKKKPTTTTTTATATATEPTPAETTTTNGDKAEETEKEKEKEKEEDGDDDNVITDEGAAQCIWLARIKPEDCENIVRYTVLQGRVVKPDSQLRGGFDRGRSLVSW